MRKYYLHIITILLVAVLSMLPVESSAQQAIELDVDVFEICENVVNLEPIGAAISFPVTVGKLCCFTRIIGAHEPTTITHVWYFGMTERARVDLTVKGNPWRTYSSKRIQAHEVGDWRVEVLDPEGSRLKVIKFLTTSGQENQKVQEEEPVPETETPDKTMPANEPTG